MKPIDRASFLKFLEHIESNREVSLAILPDDDALREFGELVEAHDYVTCHDGFEMARRLQEPSFLLSIHLSAELSKPLYDLVCQYPMTMVQLQDPVTMERIVVHPTFDGNAVLILATKKAVVGAHAKGFNLLQRVGLCWQPPPEG